MGAAFSPLIWLYAIGSATQRWHVTVGIAALAAWSYSAWRAPWKAWLADQPERQRVWLVSIVLLWLVWNLRVPLSPGLSLHFLLVTSLALMQGWSLALVAIGAVLIAQGVQHGNWLADSLAFLTDGVVPVLLTALWHGVIRRRLPRNYWVFFFVTVFAGAALAFALTGVAKVSMWALMHSLPAGMPLADDALALALLSFGEATLNGFIMAPAVIFHPEWVASIDERTYAAHAPT